MHAGVVGDDHPRGEPFIAYLLAELFIRFRLAELFTLFGTQHVLAPLRSRHGERGGVAARIGKLDLQVQRLARAAARFEGAHYARSSMLVVISPSAQHSSEPIIVQHTRLDSRQAENALMTTIAHPL